MDLIHSLILGIVEGVTEFLPVSSTGHMILTNHLLGIQESPVVIAFEVFIQLGAILAVVLLYRERFARLFDFKSKQGFSGWRGISLLGMTTLPALVLGKLFQETIKSQLFNPVTVTWALAVGGVILIFIERFRFRSEIESIDDLGYKEAFRIGLFQCLAMWPGMSRSASTIIGGMFSGLKKTTAAEYSFLAAVPIMLIVCTKELIEIWGSLNAESIQAFAIGFIVAFVSALFAVKTFILMLQRSSMAPFGVYRIIIAIIFFFILSNHPLQ